MPGVKHKPKSCEVCGVWFVRTSNAQRYCPSCGLGRKRRWREENRDKVAAMNAHQYKKRMADPALREKSYEALRQWAAENPERAKEAARERGKRHRATPSGKRRNALNTAKRRTRHRLATPPWVDKATIEVVYERAMCLRDAGINVHVDHIVPLRGENVSGLHVPWNLQIIPAKENMSKGNRHAS